MKIQAAPVPPMVTLPGGCNWSIIGGPSNDRRVAVGRQSDCAALPGKPGVSAANQFCSLLEELRVRG